MTDDGRECLAADCGRPVQGHGASVCETHREAFNAEYWFNQWNTCAEELLPAMIELASQIGNEPLEEILRTGMDRAKDEASWYECEASRLNSGL